MNLNRSYEGNKSGTIFVAEKLELKGNKNPRIMIGIFLRIQEYFNNARIILIIWPPTLNMKKLLFTYS